MRGRRACQGLPGLCEAWMPNASPQGRVHGVSRQPLTGPPTGDVHCRAFIESVFASHKKTGHKGRFFYSRSGNNNQAAA